MGVPLDSDGGADDRKTSGRWHMSAALAQEMSPPLSLLESPRLELELWERPGNCGGDQEEDGDG